jgi:hypothetical protein
MAALQGLQGLYGDPQDTTDVMDEGVLEARANDLNPEHSEYGSQSNGYSGTVPTASPFSDQAAYASWQMNPDMAGMDYNVAGEEYDKTPTTHSSPYPRGILDSSISWDNPNAAANVGVMMQELHGPELGGTTFMVGTAPAGHEEITHYTTEDYAAPNENYLSSDVPGQLRGGLANGVGASGHGNADPTQGYGVLNTLDQFNRGHSIRREQHDHMPWDFTNTHGEQDVPFPGRHPVQQMPLDGPDSPYFQQGDIDGANIVWEGRIGDPTSYVQPPEPTISPTPNPQADIYPEYSF